MKSDFLQFGTNSQYPQTTLFRGLTFIFETELVFLLRGEGYDMRQPTFMETTTLLYEGACAGANSLATSIVGTKYHPPSASYELVVNLGAPTSPTDEAIAAFAEAVAIHKEVKAVTATIEGEIIQLRTFTSTRERRLRQVIYAQELELMSRFPQLTFDFMVIPRPEACAADPASIELEGAVCCYYNGR